MARAAKCRSVLLNAYGQALKWQLVNRNPVEATDTIKEEPREMQLWEVDEADRFLETAHTHRLFAFFYLSMATGLRRGELLGLRWSDLEGNLLYVRQALVKVGNQLTLSTPKTSKGFRRVVLSPDVLEVLQLHNQQQNAECAQLGTAWPDTPRLLRQKGDKLAQVRVANTFIFTSEVGTPLNPDNLKRLRDTLMDTAKVPRVRLHDLRHLHASVAIEGGMDPKMLAERLGHSGASFTLDRYTHVFDSQRAQSAVSLSKWLNSKQKPD